MADVEIIAPPTFDPLEAMIVDGSNDDVRITPFVELDRDDRVVIDLDKKSANLNGQEGRSQGQTTPAVGS